MYSDDHNASPFNAIPPVVILLCLVIGGIELLFQGAESGFVGGPEAIGWRLDAIMTFGFFDTVFAWMLETRQVPLEHLIRFLSYSFVHGSFTHAAFTLVFILAIGYYITPALVGGDSGIFISNLIADNMQGSSAQLKLAAALATILLVAVLFIYWLFNKLVGVDKLKFG